MWNLFNKHYMISSGKINYTTKFWSKLYNLREILVVTGLIIADISETLGKKIVKIWIFWYDR
jgi:hypothetical protein